ncbi:two-component sensor histidine kinase [Minicystis rosea]|nr:two-component sensor histidine kinase [Minicystis rosea]
MLGLVVALAAALVLIGFALDVPPPALAEIRRQGLRLDTTLGIFFGGVALVLPGQPGSNRIGYYAGQVVSASVLVLGATSLFRDSGGWMISRSAVFTALGTALLLRAARRRTAMIVFAACATAAAVIPLVVLVAAAYHVPALAATTLRAGLGGLALLLLGLGTLSARPDGVIMSLYTEETAAGATLRRLLPIAIFLPVVLGWLHLYGERTALYNQASGTVLAALGLTSLFVALLFWHASALRRSEAQLRFQAELLDESHDAVVVWKMGAGIVYWSRGAEALYGWSAHEALGRRIHDLLGSEHPTSEAAVEAMLAREGRWEGKIIHTTREGRRLSVESRQRLMRPCPSEALVLEANRDITEREHADRARRESEAWLRRLWESDIIGVMYGDTQGNVRDANDFILHLLGHTRADLAEGRLRWADLTLPEPRDRPSRTSADPIAPGAALPHEKIYLGKDGRRVPILIGCAPLDDAGAQHIAFVVDLTERKRIEAEREALLESERAARSEAERAARLRDEFVATASHELRTPLNAILGWASMLKTGRLDAAAAARALEVIERNARAQAQLVDDLLDVSRVVTGKLRLDVRRVDLAEIVESHVASALPSAVAKGVRLERSVDPRAGAVHGDAGRLGQIVSNLICNAIKFTAAGGAVRVFLRRAGCRAEIVVSDTGKGVAAEFLPYIFDRFRQADASITRKHGGLGLGLALVKHLVDEHGGEIRAESDGEGRGATFTVSLPIAVEVRGERDVPSPMSARDALDGVKVLVVDDEPDARDLVCRFLADCDAEVVCVGSASEALDTLPSFRPDVLVSDIGMPDLDGYHLMRSVRALAPARGGDTPAVALTAFARDEDRLHALRAGYQVHLTKPVDQTELVVVVANLAGRHAA